MGRRSPFTKTQKRDAVLAVLAQKKTVSEVCRELGISAQTFARWREQALAGMEDALADKHDRDDHASDLERQLADAQRTIGRLAMENDLLGKASRRLT